MDKLKDKVALITGSDSGIGRAIALSFASEGCKVIVTYHSDEKGAKEVTEIIAQKGWAAICLQLDVGNEESVKNVFKRAIEHYGQIDILINNAGVNGSNILVENMDTKVFDTCIKTNLYGSFFCSRAYLKYRKDKNNGKIIFISSIHEEIATPGNADYNASKGGIKNLSRSLALELAAKGIQVNNIAPGMILTPMNKEAMENEEERKKKEQHIPLKRAGEPDEVASMAVFLASSESDYVTGSTFVIDGGLMINLGQGA
jgi:glucose 1-dehydrogenase